MHTLIYRQQHAMIRRQAKALTDGMYGELGASELRVALSRLASTVTIHFTTAQDSLYPRLTSHPDPAVRMVARRYHDSLGALARRFSAFYESWKAYGAIEHDRARFPTEARDLLEAVVARVDAEDRELYALLDELPAAS
jgi:hypothetical protein